ncbi:MAG TPA: hypothetical protein VGG39_27975 [Polyangiaceae bacterium]|jgi:hypothetical protein
MVATKEARTGYAPFRFGDVYPSPAAHEELWWFFNAAEAETDPPSNFVAFLSGEGATLDQTERRIEAAHSSGKIRKRLEALAAADLRTLAALYTERPWPPRVEKFLGVLAGPIAVLPVVRVEYLAACTRAQTEAGTVTAWLEERMARDGLKAFTHWMSDAHTACAKAIRGYDRIRGKGPSVVPSEEE